MLERKKILKHTATRETEDANFLIYEHPKSGEVYLIRTLNSAFTRRRACKEKFRCF